ncbi:MAG: hypothetical protein Q9157_008406 [Trypethelium eluteriae]
MPVLKFALTADAAGQVHNILTCLGKFSDSVFIEGRHDRALFNKSAAHNVFQISAKMLKEYSDYFAPKAEQLDMYAENGRVTFTSFTEKIMDGKEILKQPLHTAVSVDVKDFEEYRAEEKAHIIISVKDFKAIVAHAESLGVALRAQYSHPNRPLQFSYTRGGMKCEFTLMTTGSSQDSAAPRLTEAVEWRADTRSRSAPSTRSESRSTEMPRSLQNQPIASRNTLRQRGLGSVTRATPHNSDPEADSLFVPLAEDDWRWEPLEEQEPEGDTLGWDASEEQDSVLPADFSNNAHLAGPGVEGAFDTDVAPIDRVEPTQHVSQIRGLFD